MTHKSIVIYWNGQRAIENRRELISVKQLRLRLWNKKYFFRMLRYGQFGIRRLSQSQVLSAKKLQYLIDNQWKGKDPKYARKIPLGKASVYVK